MAVRVVAAPWVLLGRVAPDGDCPSKAGRTPATLHDGAVALDGDHLLAVGPRPDVEARFGPAERLHAVLLPALVNAHLHLELSHLGLVPGGEGLAAWLKRLVALRARVGEAGAEEAMARAASALEQAGVAAVGEVTNTLLSLPHLGRAGVAGRVFLEVVGFGEERIATGLAKAREARDRFGPLPAGLAIAPSPHAIYTTRERTVSGLLRAGPASIHLAEDPAERALCLSRSGDIADIARFLGASEAELLRLGTSPVATVAPWLGPASLAVHVVDLDAGDRVLLAQGGATAVLCPRSNLHIGGRVADLPRLLAAGVPVALGTDSLASSPSLAPLAEVAALAAAFPALPLDRLLGLAWNGAAVGAPHVGRLAPGLAPGILAAPLGMDPAAPFDPVAFVVAAHGARERPFTWIARQRPEAAA